MSLISKPEAAKVKGKSDISEATAAEVRIIASLSLLHEAIAKLLTFLRPLVYAQVVISGRWTSQHSV